MSSIHLEWSAVSDPGLVRKNNEDAFAVVEITEAGRTAVLPATGSAERAAAGGTVFIVSDGVGGANAGEVASELVVSAVPELLAAAGACPAGVPNRDRARKLETAVRQANGQLRQEAAANPQRTGMAATLSLLWLLPERAILAQVGDSRIYRWRRGRLVQLTHDQSEVGRMVRSGRLSEAEAKGFRGRNVIDQSMGTPAEQFDPVLDWVETEPGDVYLICSDGLVDRLENRHLEEIVSVCLARGASLPETVQELIQRSNAASGRDNTTALLVRLPGEAPDAAVPTPPALPAVSADEMPSRRRPFDIRLALVGIAVCLAGGVLGAIGMWAGIHRPRQAAFEGERQQLMVRFAEAERVRAGAEHDARSELAQRAAMIERLTVEIKEQRAALATMETRVGTAEAEVVKQRATIAELESTQEVLRTQVKDLQAALATFTEAGRDDQPEPGDPVPAGPTE